MNALTKVLVVLVLVLSAGFAASQMVLYGKREDYGSKYATASQELAKVRGALDRTTAELNDTKAALDRDRASLTDKVMSLEADVTTSASRVQELSAALTQESTHVGRLTEVTQGQEGEISQLRAQVDDQNGTIGELRGTVNDREANIANLQNVVAEKDSAIGDLSKELNQTKRERTELAEANARLNGIVVQLRQAGFEIPPAPSPAIDAVVVRVDAELGTAVIDRGSQASVKPNTQFTVYNNGGFVATLVIHDVWDTVAGGLLTRVAEGKQVQVGDLATTEIQIR